MKSAIVTLIEEASEVVSNQKGLKPFLIFEGLNPRPAVIAAELADLGWNVEFLEGFSYRFSRNDKIIEIKFEPTCEEMAEAVVISELMSKGKVAAITTDPLFSLVESIMAHGLILDEETTSVVEVLKCLLLDELPASAALWEMELIINSSPELYEMAVKL